MVIYMLFTNYWLFILTPSSLSTILFHLSDSICWAHCIYISFKAEKYMVNHHSDSNCWPLYIYPYAKKQMAIIFQTDSNCWATVHFFFLRKHCTSLKHFLRPINRLYQKALFFFWNQEEPRVPTAILFKKLKSKVQKKEMQYQKVTQVLGRTSTTTSIIHIGDYLNLNHHDFQYTLVRFKPLAFGQTLFIWS